MRELDISDISVFEEWLKEEKTYLAGLKREPEEETLQMEYWQALVDLETAEKAFFHVCCCQRCGWYPCRKDKVATWDMTSTSLGVPNAFLVGSRDSTHITETACHHAQKKVTKKLEIVHTLELQLGILHCWVPESLEWQETAWLVVMWKYQRALDYLEGLVVAQMFEITKANCAHTGQCTLHNYSYTQLTLSIM